VAKKVVTVIVNEKVIFTNLLKDNVKDMLKACDDAMEEINYLKRKIVKKVFPEFEWMYQTVSKIWECSDSPCGYCVYDYIDDPAYDTCLFCHQPEERK
jgi:hypothetical protein